VKYSACCSACVALAHRAPPRPDGQENSPRRAKPRGALRFCGVLARTSRRCVCAGRRAAAHEAVGDGDRAQSITRYLAKTLSRPPCPASPNPSAVLEKLGLRRGGRRRAVARTGHRRGERGGWGPRGARKPTRNPSRSPPRTSRANARDCRHGQGISGDHARRGACSLTPLRPTTPRCALRSSHHPRALVRGSPRRPPELPGPANPRCPMAAFRSKQPTIRFVTGESPRAVPCTTGTTNVFRDPIQSPGKAQNPRNGSRKTFVCQLCQRDSSW